MYDLDGLKLAARGQWKPILMSLGGLSGTQLNGKEQPCPKCGGNTRFRLIKADEGALLCSHCFNTKNGDGIAALQWLNDWDFKTTIANLAEFLGIKEEPKSRKIDPAKYLEFVDWNDLLAAGWCLKKKPITKAVLRRMNCRMAIYTHKGQRYKVIVMPIWSGEPTNVVGYKIFNVTGGPLPGRDGPVANKNTFGSKPGVIGWINPESDRVWKTEGQTDLLAMCLIAPDDSVVTNFSGCGENPAKYGWLAKQIDGKQVYVVHDCDQPGQKGADRWTSWLASSCETSTVKNVVLPYSIEETRGKDVRDWIGEGNTLTDLLEITGDIEPAEGSEEENTVWRADDDPDRLAQINLSYYKKNHGGRLVFWRDEWWKYKAGKYRRIGLGELKSKVWRIVSKEFENLWRDQESPEKPVRKCNDSVVRNVIHAMASRCNVPSTAPQPCWLKDRKKKNYLSFKNGILNMDSLLGSDFENCFFDHSSDWFSMFRLDYEWSADAPKPVKWLQYLDDVMESDPDRIDMLQEWAGYLLFPENKYQKFLALEGEGRNGKSVFFAAMTAMLGKENVSNVSLENFGGRFDLGTTIGKAANISGDVGEIDNVAEGLLKQYTGGDTMQFDRKNLEPIQVRPSAKLMVAWNSRPRIKDRSDGLWRRLLLVPFRYRIPDEKVVFGMDSVEWWIESGEVPGILLWALEGLRRLNKNKRFTFCQISQDVIDEYRTDSNPALRFLHETAQFVAPSKDYPDVYTETQKLYEIYRHWCSKQNHHPLNQTHFGRQVKKTFPGTDRVRMTRNGHKVYYYAGVELTVSEVHGKSVDENLF